MRFLGCRLYEAFICIGGATISDDDDLSSSSSRVETRNLIWHPMSTSGGARQRQVQNFWQFLGVDKKNLATKSGLMIWLRSQNAGERRVEIGERLEAATARIAAEVDEAC